MLPQCGARTRQSATDDGERAMRLLVIEDEPEMALALQSALRRHDMIADHADGMAAAMEMIVAGTYDAIILDRGLPEGDGLTLIPQIRRHKSSIPVIVLPAWMAAPMITWRSPSPSRNFWRVCAPSCGDPIT